MRVLISKLVDGFLDSGIITEEERDIYEFGLGQTMVTAFNLITILAIGIFSGELSNLIIFTSAYVFLRQYAGGYHAETGLGCYMISILMIFVALIVSRFIELDMVSNLAALSVSSYVLLNFSPVEDYNKPLDDMEIFVYRRKLKEVMVIEVIVLFGSLTFAPDIAKMIITAMATMGFMVLLGILKNRKVKSKFTIDQ